MLNDYSLEKPTIETEHLTIRPFSIHDIDDLQEWTPKKELYQYWGKGPSKLDLNPRLLFDKENKPSKSFHLGIELNETKKVVGDLWIYLIEKNQIAKIAIRISPLHHNKGIGTEAVKGIVDFCFTNTELKRIWSDVHIDNVSSCRMLEKSGFVKEGLIRQGKMVSTICDYYIYGIVKEDL